MHINCSLAPSNLAAPSQYGTEELSGQLSERRKGNGSCYCQERDAATFRVFILSGAAPSSSTSCTSQFFRKPVSVSWVIPENSEVSRLLEFQFAKQSFTYLELFPNTCHRLIEYPKLERTHKDHGVQFLMLEVDACQSQSTSAAMPWVSRKDLADLLPCLFECLQTGTFLTLATTSRLS